MPGEQEGGSNPSGMVSLAEIEEGTKAASPEAKSGEIVLEGDDVPEEYRGKSVAAVLAEANASRKALQISEDAREALRRSDRPREEEPTTRQPAVEEIQEPTREQLQELYEKDPLEAIATMQNIALRRAEQHMNVRLGHLTDSTASATENWAKQEFADEFKVLGPQIEAFRRTIPDQTVFTTKKGWEDLISYVRGQRGNFEKYIDYVQNGKTQRTSGDARREEVSSTGFSPRPSTRSAVPTEDVADMDPVTKKIADEFIAAGTFKDYAEYVRWSKIGGGR